MMNFWTQHRLRSQVKDFLKAFRKQRVYNSDVIPPAHRERIENYEAELSAALREGKSEQYQPLLQKGDALAAELFPIQKGDALCENIEVVFVAVVAALALRAYFLQPFKIPTDSMKPTLYGIQTVPTEEVPPSFPVRLFKAIVFGRTYGLVRFDHPVTLLKMEGGSLTSFFPFTDLVFDTGERERVWIGLSGAYRLGLRPGQSFAANEVVAHYVNDTGDQVLVDKVSYNFRLPKRGEVFVFRTNGIEGIESKMRQQGITTSEYYIKRCVGVPNDVLRILTPNLEINGSIDSGNAAIKRVEAARDGYRGYDIIRDQAFLRTPQETYQVEPDSFWAMGDNSYNSLDSRFWGPVPRTNLVGTGFIVYWPFGPRWGLIH